MRNDWDDEDGCPDDLDEVTAASGFWLAEVGRSSGSGTGKDLRCWAQKILTEGASHCGIEQGMRRAG